MDDRPYEFRCRQCGRLYVECPARADGEDTFVGYYPCVCSMDAYFINRNDGETYAEYRHRVGRLPVTA